MSEYTTTPNYSLKKPNVNADSDMWGDHLNQDLDTLDSIIHGIDVRPAGGVTSWNARKGDVVLSSADVTTALTYTPYDASNPAGYQTAAQVPQGSNSPPQMDAASAQAGTASQWARSDHVHPTDTSRYAASNPAGYQTAAQVTASLGAYAPLASPPLTGNPTAPTPPPGDNDTSIATTAFVTAALGALPAAGATMADTPPASPSPGALWWDSVGGNLYLRFNDGTSQQWVPATNIPSVANAATKADVATALNDVGRNLIHNPLFNISQRGVGPFTTGGNTLDRWYSAFALDTVSLQQVQFPDVSRTQIGDEAANNYLTNVFTGNAGAGSYNFIQQRMEDVRRLAGKTVTVSFWANATGTQKLGINIGQNFGTGGSPSAAGRVLTTGMSVTLSGTMTRYSVSIPVTTIIGKTVGTNNDHYTALEIWYSSGGTFNAIAGNIGVQSGTVNLWGMQLEIGPTATPLEKPDPQQDLAKCQRFYQTGIMQHYSYNGAGGNFSTSSSLLQFMRAVPTMTFGVQNNANCTITAVGSLGAQQVNMYGTVTATGQFQAQASYTASADL